MSLCTSWFDFRIALMSSSTKKLNESRCCLTRPLTLRKAGNSSHLSCYPACQLGPSRLLSSTTVILNVTYLDRLGSLRVPLGTLLATVRLLHQLAPFLLAHVDLRLDIDGWLLLTSTCSTRGGSTNRRTRSRWSSRTGRSSRLSTARSRCRTASRARSRCCRSTRGFARRARDRARAGFRRHCCCPLPWRCLRSVIDVEGMAKILIV